MRYGKRLGLAAALAVAGALLLSGHEAGAAGAGNVRIGLVKTLFRSIPSSMMNVISRPLKVLMESQTGMGGELEIAGDAFALGDKLREKQVELGVFHGVEFAWARARNPDLKPLVIVVCNHRELHAHLVVHKKCDASCCRDLKGKVLTMPHMSREHCHLYLQRRCPGDGVDPRKFFSDICVCPQAEGALDDVIEGAAHAALVDRAALDDYQRRKPARSSRLRVLHQSETFPAAVIAYQSGSMDEGTLQRFRDGLLSAHRTPRGKELLRMCRITRFEDVPAGYDELLQEIARAYPPAGKGK
jgi:ABC-type phosphate/phosphonate transport system substrate-binding protein